MAAPGVVVVVARFLQAGAPTATSTVRAHAIAMRAGDGYNFEVRTRTLALFTTLGLLTELYAGTSARANGRYPAAQMLATRPGDDDAQTMALRTTFGLLLSKDGGKSFRWVCEKALGF